MKVNLKKSVGGNEIISNRTIEGRCRRLRESLIDKMTDEGWKRIGERGRLNRHGVEKSVKKWAINFGLHNPVSNKLEDHFTCHTMRHCNTTYLRRNGMPREFIKELRGDKRNQTIDIYDHINLQELKRAYLSAMPKFNLY